MFEQPSPLVGARMGLLVAIIPQLGLAANQCAQDEEKCVG
jgi:hypothetical protein